MIFKYFNRHKGGFTIVELIVATAIFVVAVSVVTGIFIRSVKIQRLVNDVMAMNSNASLGLEQIMREIRTGFDFQIINTGNVCDTPHASFDTGLGDTLTFTRARGDVLTNVIYHWNQVEADIERTEGASPFSVLTAANVKVRRLCFLLSRENDAISSPWRVSLFLKIGPRGDSSPENIINLETTVSARILPSELLP